MAPDWKFDGFKNSMHATKTGQALFMAGMICIISCAPSLIEVGQTQGCYAAEEYLDAYIVRKVKRERFKRNLPYRVALLPLSVTVGFFLNFIGQLEFVVPLLAPSGYSLSGSDFKALFLTNAVNYSPFRGSRLDEVDDSVIAHANLDIGMCYYQADNYAQASAFFESLADSRYAIYVGRENLHFLLGDCYYMLSMYETSIDNYRLFLDYCLPDDQRISLVKRRIRTIDALNKKGLWGIEDEE